jgi:hypothetical protein
MRALNFTLNRMLEIIILVSSANKIDSDIEFILRTSFIYIANNRSPKIDPGGNSMFQCTPVREVSSCVR